MKRTLAVILILAALLFALSLVLNPLARKIRQDEHVWLMETLLPGGKDFVRLSDTGEDEIIKSVHKSSAGFVIETLTYGYADEIIMLIGVDNQGKVTGLVTYDAHETIGLGSKILTDAEFLSQFLNKSGNFTITSPSADIYSGATGEVNTEGEDITVDGISGATVSSKAVARCVSAAVAYVTGADIDSSATSWGE